VIRYAEDLLKNNDKLRQENQRLLMENDELKEKWKKNIEK
jgi:hypothetical protein